MKKENLNIINNLIDNYCILNDDLYYNIDFYLISIISYNLSKLNLYYPDNYLYYMISNRIKNRNKIVWSKHKNIIKKRKKIYNLIDYIIEKKNINNFDTYLKYKIAEYYIY